MATDGASVSDQRSETAPGDALSPDGGCRSLGCGCAGNSACDSGLCLDKVAATPDLYNAAGGTSFCSSPCCTSSDCPGGTVCFATGAGGNYCVDPALLQDRSTPGAGMGGQACTDGTGCRSGRCVSGVCVDTCCSTAATDECAGGSVCAFADFPGTGFDVHFGGNCAKTSGTLTDGAACSANTDCQSGFCNKDSTVLHCAAVCRRSADCATGRACAYFVPPGVTGSGNDIIAACLPNAGTLGPGQACTTSQDCADGLCFSASGGSACSDVCVANADCPSALPHCVVTTLMFMAAGQLEAPICGL
jgi:hypothetical protein